VPCLPTLDNIMESIYNDDDIVLYSSNSKNNSNNSFKYNRYNITYYLSNIIISDHLLLTQSTNFENLPTICFKLSHQIIEIILSNYLKPNQHSWKEFINPKVYSLISDYWITLNPLLILTPVYDNGNGNSKSDQPQQHLQDLISILVFENIENDLEYYSMIETFVLSLHSILLDIFFNFPFNYTEKYTEQQRNSINLYLNNCFTTTYLENLINSINNQTTANKEDISLSIDKLTQIIQISLTPLQCLSPNIDKGQYISVLKKIIHPTSLLNTILNENIIDR
ncbi:hypothetical protein CYY_007859, partial [Polysphondylium violaceum]